MARQELSSSELGSIDAAWINDVSVGGAPNGWGRESFQKKVEDKIFNGISFNRALMLTLAQCPRPDDPKAKQAASKQQMREDITDKVAKLKALKLAQFERDKGKKGLIKL